ERHGEDPAPGAVIRYRRVILGLMIPMVIVAAAAVPRLPFDFNALHLRDPSTESVSTFQELLEDPDTSPYVIQVLAENLPVADALADRIRTVPEVDRVLTLSSFVPGDQEEKLAIIDEMALVLEPVLIPQAAAETPGDDEEVQAMKELRAALDAQAVANRQGELVRNLETLGQEIDGLLDDARGSTRFVPDLRARLLGDFPQWLERLRTLLSPGEITLATLPRSLVSHYSAQDGRTRVEVFPAENVEENRALRRFVNSVRQHVPGAIGSPVSILEGGQTVIDACVQATVLAVVLSALLLLVVLRRMGETFFVLLPLLLTLLFTVATCLALDVPLNLANVVALPLVLGLGIAFGIYLILRRREAGSRSIVRVLGSSTSQAVLFSALTTMASFGALGFSPHPGMASLGILLVVVLILALVSALVILPALLAEWERR
ncbi:MAG: MMPL family transporter, partial [Nitrospira sp. SB0661_bin_20]|nr:MMPL family transporter [Nitrospira sp. SB0661_bin_20]